MTLARWLGHSSPAITLGYYAHLMPEAGSKGRGVIDGALGERGGRQANRNSPDSPRIVDHDFLPGAPGSSDPWIARLKRWVT
ncbi:hypothetical protein [Streptomyces sp. NBC_00893]|uniref:hypothetical protein n=1 Tax=Streptomyces sp. NBC_00893 TaxID=2975862 RepID=UPI00225B005C|nr:hypothetical protein [Streptomyces sp. NBC_00893]MCX4849445.1 hypothetical protein [Streptomyces sp. NBC_00893]